MTTAILKSTGKKYIGRIQEQVKTENHTIKGGFYCKLLKNDKPFGKSCFFNLSDVEFI